MVEGASGKAPAACNEIPWDLFGLSMANYNVAIAALMALLCVMALREKSAG
jgi:disulfide bond formation protein DsbB